MTRLATEGMAIAIAGFASAAAADPDCSGPDRWAAGSTFTQLKNARVLTNDEVDLSRTISVQIASQKIGRNLYRQVFRITYFLKNGEDVLAIAVSNASKQECSMSDVEVYRVIVVPEEIDVR